MSAVRSTSHRPALLVLLVICLLATGQLVLFASFDLRGVNDHDPDFGV